MKAANGYGNFDRLRKKIMYSINKDIPIQATKKRKIILIRYFDEERSIILMLLFRRLSNLKGF